MNKFRQNRVNESARQELCEIIRSVKDPRVEGAFVTITAVEVTADLKYAKVYFSAITGDPDEIKKGLTSAHGYIRRELAARLNLRVTPELKFFHDDSVEKGARISDILKQINNE